VFNNFLKRKKQCELIANVSFFVLIGAAADVKVSLLYSEK